MCQTLSADHSCEIAFNEHTSSGSITTLTEKVMSKREKHGKSIHSGKRNVPPPKALDLGVGTTMAASASSHPLHLPSEHPAAMPGSSKIAIPRLRHDSDGPSSLATSSLIDKSRVTHACEPCRNRKTKCSGERPVCIHCTDFNLECTYAEGKRDRAKK